MQEKAPDRRIKRTQQQLRDALESLILEKGYEAVTVQDIIDRANVGRSTFYAHFWSKENLLLSGFENLKLQFEERYQDILAHRSTGGNNSMELSLLLFQHTQNYHPLYKALLGKGGSEVVIKEFQKYVTEQMQKHLSEGWGHNPNLKDIPPDLVIHFLSSSLLSLLTWWLDNDLPVSAERISQLYHQMAVDPLMKG